MISNKERKIIENISKKHNLKLFILFGSRADKTNRKDSDWDFAILPNKKISYEDEMQIYSELDPITKFNKIDLINLKETEDPLLNYEIFTKGICIYEKKEELFGQMQTNAIFNYIEYKPIFKIEEEIIKNLIEAL